MKTGKLFLFIWLLFSTASLFGAPVKTKGPEQDTIIVSFGKKGKMVIYVDNKEDFKVLKAYDLNALLSKIDVYLDSTQEEDYMNDTAFIFHTPYRVNGKAGDQEVSIKVENLDQKIEEIGKNIEKTAENIGKAAENAERITLRLGSLNVDINPKENNEEKVKVYTKHEETKKIRYYFTLNLGLNNYAQNGRIPSKESIPYVLSPLRSRYFAVNFIQKVKLAGPLYLTTGLELAFNNYMFRDEVEITKQNGVLTFPQLERDARKSKLATTYLNVPVMPMLDFKGKFKIGIGGYVGYRLASHSKIKYTSGDDIKDKHRGNFYLNDWRYGVRGMIGIKSVKFFANYDLNTLFKENRAPKLNSFSFGIII